MDIRSGLGSDSEQTQPKQSVSQSSESQNPTMTSPQMDVLSTSQIKRMDLPTSVIFGNADQEIFSVKNIPITYLSETSTTKVCAPKDPDINAEDNEIKLIAPGIYIGNLTSAKNEIQLKNHSIKAILSILFEPPYFEHKEIVDKIILVDKGEYFDLLRIIPETFEFISQSISSNENILINCLDGISRSPIIILAYLMKNENLKMINALTLINSKKFIKLHVGILEQLALFEMVNYEITLSNIWCKRYFYHRMYIEHRQDNLSGCLNYFKIFFNYIWETITSLYCCRQCDERLFQPDDIIQKDPDDKENQFFYIYPVHWICSSNSYLNQKGIICCPNCDNIVGKFDWNGFRKHKEYEYEIKLDSNQAIKRLLPIPIVFLMNKDQLVRY